MLGLWQAEQEVWLRRHGINPAAANWRDQLDALGSTLVREYQLHLSDRWNNRLDECHGDCVLLRSNIGKIVADSLLFFDGDRYELTDFVVMPNHVHLLVAFPDENALLRQCESWKRFTALKINQALKRTGRFWQQDGFDHLVRSADQFDYLRGYIRDNPSCAGLVEGEFVHWSKAL